MAGPPPKKKIRGIYTFATINDLHIVDTESTAIVNRAVHMINEDPEIEFVVVLGDLGTDGRLVEMELAKISLEKLERPYFVIPGNHDVNVTLLSDEYDNYRDAFETLNFRQRENGWLFLGLDTCEGTASTVSVEPQQLRWIERQLEGVGRKRPIALMTHHPLNPNTAAYRVENAEEVLDVFSDHNLKLVASGHYHGNQVEERDGVLFTTTACCSTTRDNHDGTDAKGFRLFRIDKRDTLRTEFVRVPG